MNRVKHSDIAKAVHRLNVRRGFEYGMAGYLQYADIRGDGGPYRPGFYAAIADGKGSGVVCMDSKYRRETMRATFAYIEGMD